MVMTRAPEPDLGAFTGVKLLRMVATALVDLSRRSRLPDPIYSDKVQKAYNHLVVQCLRHRVDPPPSVPDMARWAATRRLGEWPMDLPADVESLDEFLVDPVTKVPTQRCYEWEVAGPDAAAELFENEIIRQVFVRCETAKSPQAYTAFRYLLVNRPVLTGLEMASLIGETPALGIVLEAVKQCYEPAPAAFRGHDGLFATCARCKCLLKPHGAGWRCELDRCRRESYATPKRHIDDRITSGLLQLRAPLRLFITGPGLAEVDLEAALKKKGLVAEMWPGCDAYDLRITLPNRQVWAIDVKDRANPALLGYGATAFRREPRYDTAFLVVPQYRFDDREDYKRVFDHYCPPDVKRQVTLMSDKAFLRHLTKTLKRLPNSTSNGDERA